MMTARSLARFLSNLWIKMYQDGRFVSGAAEQGYLIVLDTRQDLVAVPVATGKPGEHRVVFGEGDICIALKKAKLSDRPIIGVAHNHPPPKNPVVRTQQGASSVSTCYIANPMPSAGDLDGVPSTYVFNLNLSFYEIWIDLRSSGDDRRFYRLTNQGKSTSSNPGSLAFEVAEYQTYRNPTSGGGGTLLRPQVPSLCSLKRHSTTQAADLRFVYSFVFDEQVVEEVGGQQEAEHYTTQWWQVVRSGKAVRRSSSRQDNPLTANAFFPRLSTLLKSTLAASVSAQKARKTAAADPTAGSPAVSHPLTRASLTLAESALRSSGQEVLNSSVLDYAASPSQSSEEVV